MLAVTRTWNAVVAAAGMQRALALARDYAGRRLAFGAPLADLPLHRATLAGLEAEREGAFLLAFRAAALLGAREGGDRTRALLRVVTPLAKLCTARQLPPSHAQWCLAAGRGRRAVAAARTLARRGVDLVDVPAADEDDLLARPT